VAELSEEAEAFPNRLEELERLSKLRDSGALTEAEFNAEKARILQQG
jgi:hypothetical protein